MNRHSRIHHIHLARRARGVLATLASCLLALAAAPAAMAQPWPHPHGPATPRIQTVAVGGMAGWQITLIAAGAALCAAAVAVLLDRTRQARRGVKEATT